jgi:hypothetical protein
MDGGGGDWKGSWRGGSVEEGRERRRVGERLGRERRLRGGGGSGIVFGIILYKANTISSIHSLMNGLK